MNVGAASRDAGLAGGGEDSGQNADFREIEIGVAGSRNGDNGLALIRLDKLADARAAGVAPTAGGATLEFLVEQPAG